jgi:hypothetical protein
MEMEILASSHFSFEGAVEIVDNRPHKRYAFLFNDVLLLARTKGRSFKVIIGFIVVYVFV